MRKQVSIVTYQKIQKFFIDKPKEEVTQTFLRDSLNLDYLSVKVVLDMLINEGEIEQIKNKYRRK